MKIYNLRLDDNTNKIYYGAGTNGSIELLQGSGTSGGAGNTLTGTNGIVIENNKVGLGGRFLTTTEDVNGLTSTMELDSNNFRIYQKVGSQDILTFKLEPNTFLCATESTSFDYSTISNSSNKFEIDNGSGDGNSYHTLEVSENGLTVDSYLAYSTVERYSTLSSDYAGLNYSGNFDDGVFPSDSTFQTSSQSFVYDGNDSVLGNTRLFVSGSPFSSNYFNVKVNDIELIKNRTLYSTTGVALLDFSGDNLETSKIPVNKYDIVNKDYADYIIQNVNYRTTTNLTATYNNGVSGVGATLTATTNVVLPTQDGITTGNQTVGDRILVANQTTALQNGIYVLTSKGVVGVSPWILTRATDSDSSDKIYKRIIKVDLGNTFASSTMINSNTTAITMGTTNITYATHGGFIGGAGVSLTNKTFSIGAAAITRAMLANGVATSVIGRSTNSTGAVADIQATTSGQVLKRFGTTLGFHNIGFSDLPFQILSNTFTATGTATTTFTVSIGQTLGNTTYKVNITPNNLLTSALYYVNNKTTTTFDVVFQTALTGSVSFDWMLYR